MRFLKIKKINEIVENKKIILNANDLTNLI